MHQFMCHKFLKFAFGPQINFIIGEWQLSAALDSLINNLCRAQRKWVIS